eukprot:CAMPEP_0117050062 /NCGR_PEP_ID=MMETSP0472-20121206/34562_1 /TAXON_ID=693140 ORGANISM="Tiarina fusus, Strain LIS" /NCGR_SAMPLE_ID=MMETSP0472 /ASSEMBLY_ACC=CAM_ASM_000603 /LENGTH=63 /DNA_ID=CAMNT_0004763695 /DNA_START=14 /DNA_END=205 /DNA_ORIENTATION=+
MVLQKMFGALSFVRGAQEEDKELGGGMGSGRRFLHAYTPGHESKQEKKARSQAIGAFMNQTHF